MIWLLSMLPQVIKGILCVHRLLRLKGVATGFEKIKTY